MQNLPITRTDLLLIEFVGGPLDGFQPDISSLGGDHSLRTPEESYLALPINVNVIQAVSQQAIGERRPATSVAIYELAGGNLGAAVQRYDYVGPATVESFHLNQWTG